MLFIAAVISALSLPAISADSDSRYQEYHFSHDMDGASSLTPDLLEKQSRQLQQEISLLRAEEAQANGDVQMARLQLEEIDNDGDASPEFEQRIQGVKGFLERLGRGVAGLFDSQSQKTFKFPLEDSGSVTAVLLPLSGQYSTLSKVLKASIERNLQAYGYSGKLIFFDTDQFSSATALWSLLKNYQPSFIFGPLSKQWVSSWQALDINIPTLYFNEPGSEQASYERSLMFGKKGGLLQLFAVLRNADYRKVLVLSDESASSQAMLQQFTANWKILYPGMSFESELWSSDSVNFLEERLGIQASQQRAGYLRKIIRQPLESFPRIRQDFDAIISLLPLQTAIQVEPFLELYQQKHSTHIWYPPRLPSTGLFSGSLSDWQKTLALLPSYYLQNLSDPNSSNQYGLFSALGKTAVEIATSKTLITAENRTFALEEGWVWLDDKGRFQYLPGAYWLNRGVVKPLMEQGTQAH
ncbi:penicillin-binding protein activator [Thiomicrorhabdus heinhorstiae]|uniref:Penicillin-binding protein activator n=1 Tax=Thiomicrorhabdus heinhorstiae TaxID=2748010 RepID=A0ABS0C3I4_9GAMM|nr:penicillin-binding protein activator [Thiomicrorhabdus heinhorstiae]MBF6058696.1 penicillin-binding protein activator [Thiomicrorhabdus heinhorstiae]